MIEISQLESMTHLCEHILKKLEGEMVTLLPEALEIVQKYLDDDAAPLDCIVAYEIQHARLRTFAGRIKIRLTIDIDGILVLVDSDQVSFN